MNMEIYYGIIPRWKPTPETKPIIDDIKRQVRRETHECRDPLKKPMSEEWRRVWKEDSELLYEFRILPDAGQTDDELRDMLDDMTIRFNSPYDCTGRLFTCWTSYRRMPGGISLIHCMALDV